MVYGCAFWPARDGNFSKEMKKKFGFADSKKLNEDQREQIYAKIKVAEYKDLGFFVTVLDAQYLSATMMADSNRGGKNLNVISHETAINLIKRVRDLGFRI